MGADYMSAPFVILCQVYFYIKNSILKQRG